MAFGKRAVPAKNESSCPAQLLRRRKKLEEEVHDPIKDLEWLFDDRYGHRADVDATFKAVLKRVLFVQCLVLKWLEKVLD